MAIELEVDEPVAPANEVGRRPWHIHIQRRTLLAAAPIAATIVLVLLTAVLAPWIGVPLAVLAMGLIACGLVATLIVLLARPERALS
jgi:hypothetical protein